MACFLVDDPPVEDGPCPEPDEHSYVGEQSISEDGPQKGVTQRLRERSASFARMRQRLVRRNLIRCQCPLRLTIKIGTW